MLGEIVDLFADGTFKPVVDRSFGFSEAAAAHRYIFEYVPNRYSVTDDNLTASDAIEIKGVNGSIEAVFEALGSGQRVKCDTVNGKVALYLPADASARIEAETVNGSIDGDDFGLKVEKGFVGRDLDGMIGEGDARVRLETVNGSIRIKKN